MRSVLYKTLALFVIGSHQLMTMDDISLSRSLGDRPTSPTVQFLKGLDVDPVSLIVATTMRLRYQNGGRYQQTILHNLKTLDRGQSTKELAEDAFLEALKTGLLRVSAHSKLTKKDLQPDTLPSLRRFMQSQIDLSEAAFNLDFFEIKHDVILSCQNGTFKLMVEFPCQYHSSASKESIILQFYEKGLAWASEIADKRCELREKSSMVSCIELSL